MPDTLPFAPSGAVADFPAHAAGMLGRLRAARPRVHAITNAAAQVLTANLLLAAGAIPSLTVAADEVTAFTARADAVLVNLGTLDAERRAAIPWAIATARASNKPWVLDPVFVEASRSRLEIARLSLTGHPVIVRCNLAEFEALADGDASEAGVAAFARAHGCVVALTGPTDRVTDGDRTVLIDNGHALMTRVTAMGCAAGALVAAFAAVEDDAWLAAAGALLVMGIAGERAGRDASGPGSFQPALLDALHALDAAAIVREARVR